MNNRKHVILVHGLYMPSWIMQYTDRHFKKMGYATHRFGYNSLKFPAAARRLNAFVGSRFGEDDQVYFFGHSLGGLVIRNYFSAFKPKFRDTAIVTAGTPHNGAEIARVLSDKNFGFLFGESQYILTKGIGDYHGDVPLGVITGVCDIGVGRIVLGKRLGDGTVTRDDTGLRGAKSKLELRLSHTTLVYSKSVAEHASEFFENKEF